MIPSGDIRRGEREKGQGDERGGRKGDEAPKGQTDHGTQWRGAPRGRTLTLTLKLHRNPNVGVCLFVFLFVVSSPSSLPTRHTNHLPSHFCYSPSQLTYFWGGGPMGSNDCEHTGPPAGPPVRKNASHGNAPSKVVEFSSLMCNVCTGLNPF